MPVVVNLVYDTNNVNAGKFAGSEPWSVVNAGIYSHSGGAGAVPVMDFEGKVSTLIAIVDNGGVYDSDGGGRSHSGGV